MILSLNREQLVRLELDFVPAENIIFFAARAVGALQTANEQNRHAQGDQDGQHTRVRTDELSNRVHMS